MKKKQKKMMIRTKGKMQQERLDHIAHNKDAACDTQNHGRS